MIMWNEDWARLHFFLFWLTFCVYFWPISLFLYSSTWRMKGERRSPSASASWDPSSSLRFKKWSWSLWWWWWWLQWRNQVFFLTHHKKNFSHQRRMTIIVLMFKMVMMALMIIFCGNNGKTKETKGIVLSCTRCVTSLGEQLGNMVDGILCSHCILNLVFILCKMNCKIWTEYWKLGSNGLSKMFFAKSKSIRIFSKVFITTLDFSQRSFKDRQQLPRCSWKRIKILGWQSILIIMRGGGASNYNQTFDQSSFAKLSTPAVSFHSNVLFRECVWTHCALHIQKDYQKSKVHTCVW